MFEEGNGMTETEFYMIFFNIVFVLEGNNLLFPMVNRGKVASGNTLCVLQA